MCDCCKKGKAIHEVKKPDGQVAKYCPVCFLVLAFSSKRETNQLQPVD